MPNESVHQAGDVVVRNGALWRIPSRSDMDSAISHDWGVARRSLGRPNPPLHIVHREGNDWKTWCGGGPAEEGIRNVTGRVCAKCQTLARQENEEYADG